MNILITYFLILIGSFSALSFQNFPDKGVPLLHNFTPSEYDHQGKIWSIDSAPDGIIYMAADKGLVEYDGETWKNYTGSDGITRSVYVANDSLIYTGSDLDFGMWKRNAFQDFEYTSLYPFKEELNDINEEFWDVYPLKENILFLSESNIYIFKDQNLTKIQAPYKIKSSFKVNGVLYFIDEQKGLFKLKDLAPQQIFEFSEEQNFEVAGIYQDRDALVLVTKNNGLYQYASGKISPVNNQLSEELKTANVFSFERISNSHLAFGTILNGLFISDLKGNLKQTVDKNKGLQNNTILSMEYSPSGKLWLGMDYGVSYLDLSNEFTFFYDYRGNFGTGYSAVLKNDEFYLGTNQGLYQTKWESLNNKYEFNQFELISGTKGQVWTLKNIENQLLIGHDRGLFVLRNNGVERLSHQRGFWTIEQYKGYLLAGTYNGISIFKKSQGEWVFWKKMELILGSCNQIAIEGENTLWVNIPNYGIIKAELNEELYPEDREIFLSERFSGSDHYLRKEKNTVEILTDKFQYTYEADSNEFIAKTREEINPEINDLLLRNAHPGQLNSRYEFFPVYNGFALKDRTIRSSAQDSAGELLFRKIEAFNNDSTIEILRGSDISYQMNNVRVVSRVPNMEDVAYQFKEGASDRWSEWSSDGTLELIGLRHGKHVLFARAKVDGVVTPPQSISFMITKPWYLSWYAYLFYLLLVLGMIYLLYIWQGMSLNRQKKDLLIDQRHYLKEQKDRHHQQLRIVEEKKLQAEYEQMKAQLKSKKIELATKAKENDEKNKILKTLKEKVELMEQNPDSMKRRADEIQKIINSHISSENNTFEIQIDDLHQKFYDSLRNLFPELTRYDLRLCAYIKIGFDSKEIADLLNIKPSSVYISRSRLRSKLNIDSEEDLHSYLNSI